MAQIIVRLALEVGDHKWRLRLQQPIVPALFKVPVIQTRQEHFIGGIGDHAIGLVLAFGNSGQLAINKTGIRCSQFVNRKHDLEDEIIALLAEIEVLFAGVLGSCERELALRSIGNKGDKHLFGTLIHNPGIGKV